jgi:hypothetical protein
MFAQEKIKTHEKLKSTIIRKRVIGGDPWLRGRYLEK